MKKTLLWIMLLFAASGCMVGPNYERPHYHIAEEWNGVLQDDDVEFSEEDFTTNWWTIFDDEMLSRYIEMGAASNKDILIAEANILQARGMRTVAASKLFPHVNADFNATKTYFSKNGPVFAIGQAAGDPTDISSPTTGLPFTAQIPQIQPLYNALLDATWEIDLFGKTRRNVEAAQATLESIIEQRNDVLISVLAEIALNYMDLRSSQKLAALIEKNIALLTQNAEIVTQQLEAGYVNQLDYQNIEAELATLRSTLLEVHAQIYRDIYALSILTGNYPEVLVDELLPFKELPKTPKHVAIGLRSTLLRRRPDVRFAERQLAAATANVGVAVASFYPTITLLGDGGFQSLKIKNLFSLSSRTWALGGDINMPIFQGGRLIGNLRASEAATSAAAYTYQKTILSALQDTESTLISYSDSITAAGDLSEAACRNRMMVEITKERFEKGLVNLINFNNSERQLIAAEENLVKSETKALLELIRLYKSLGGGWEPTQECN